MRRHRYPRIPVVTVAILTTLLATTGCGPQPDRSASSTSPAAPTPAARTVTVERTGGIAGAHDTTVVHPGGEWTRTDRAGTRRTGRLSGEQQRELRRLLADPRLPAEARRTTPTTCRDAFEYLVTIDTLRIGYVDCPSDPDLPVAAMAIVALVEAAAHR